MKTSPPKHVSITSPEILLNPGIEMDGQRITTATVRLLTDGGQAELDRIEDPIERERRSLFHHINSLGGKTDRQIIEYLVDLLLWPDEERIRRGINDLYQEWADAFNPAAGAQRRELSASEWQEAIRTPIGRNALITSKWNMLAAFAWRGYMESGRGYVYAYVDDVANASGVSGPIQVAYYALDEDRAVSRILQAEASDTFLEPTMQTHLALRRLATSVMDYNPHREIVLLLLVRDVDRSHVYCECLEAPSSTQMDPPDAWLAEREALLLNSDSTLNSSLPESLQRIQ